MSTAQESALPPESESAQINCPVCKVELCTPPGKTARSVLCSRCLEEVDLPGRRHRRLSWMAAISLILGFSSLLFSLITGIPAILVGLAALHNLRENPRKVGGKGMAIAGIVLGSTLSFTLILVPLAATWWIEPGGLRGEYSPSESAALEGECIVPLGGEWRWLHPLDGVDPETGLPGFAKNFANLDFDDTTWNSGGEDPELPRGFGYGDAVTVDIGAPPRGSRYTAYFRHRFFTRRRFTDLQLRLWFDDGIIVYLNGVELLRENMPSGPDAYGLLSRRTMRESSEQVPQVFSLPGELHAGDQVLAVSVHNSSTNSSDLHFGAVELWGSPE